MYILFREVLLKFCAKLRIKVGSNKGRLVSATKLHIDTLVHISCMCYRGTQPREVVMYPATFNNMVQILFLGNDIADVHK